MCLVQSWNLIVSIEVIVLRLSQNRVVWVLSFKNPRSMSKWQIHIVLVLGFIKAMYLASILDNANCLPLMT
jgi:hypothetical protein